MISQTIQLSLAPVFMLVAIGNILNLMTTRLARVVDRARILRARHAETQGVDHDVIVAEMRFIDQRFEIVNHAIRMLVLAGVCIGVTVGLLFIQNLFGVDWHGIAAVTFLLAVTLLLSSLVLFLRETQIAAKSLRIPRDMLELERKI